MPDDAGSTTYSLREPFDRAVESVSKALAASRGLKVAGHLDVARRIERALGITLPPCRIIFVLPNPAVLSSDSVHPSTAIFLPLHVVVSGGQTHTEIQVQNRVRVAPGTAQTRIAPIVAAQAQISAALERIAMRPSLMV